MDQAAQNKIIVDHERAQKYGTQWIVSMNNELFARGLILNSAMNKFNAFLNLPESSSRSGFIWDLAFTILSTAVPALGLAKFIAAVKKDAEIALEVAKKVQKTANIKDRAKYIAASGAQVAGNTVEKVNAAKETAGKVKDSYEGATKEVESGTSQLGKLDATRGPIKNLIDDSRNAESAWNAALEAELAEFENRLNERKSGVTLSLEDYIKDKLKPVPKLTDDELTEVETLFLWEMIAKYVKDNVVIEKTVYAGRGGSSRRTTEEIKGLNNTQWETILSLFGPSAKRNRIFFKPILLPVQGTYKYIFLNAIGGVKTNQTVVEPIERGNRI